MEVHETNWGKVIDWGYSCRDSLRDLRKLNDMFREHHPEYESFCKRSDELNARGLELLSKLDTLCKENENIRWSVEVAAEYDSLVHEFEECSEELYNLCVFEYPKDAHKYHYSYCV